jgi:hypothetical protein
MSKINLSFDYTSIKQKNKNYQNEKKDCCRKLENA